MGGRVMTESKTDLEELLRLLGNEARLRIMRELWEEFEFSDYVIEDQRGMSFSELQDRSAIDDPGNFNYHLGELTGTLIQTRDNGYSLSPLGYNLMKSLDRFSSFAYETRDAWILDDSCPFCHGQLEARYRREILEVRCLRCAGLGGDGNFTFVDLGGIGTISLDNEEILEAATLTMNSKLRSSMHGICWACHDRSTITIERCQDHQTHQSSNCDHCNARFAWIVIVNCSTCGTGGRGPLTEFAICSPIVGSFFADYHSGPNQIGPWRYRLTALEAVSEEDTGDDRAVMEFHAGGQSLQVAFDINDHPVAPYRPDLSSVN